MRTLSASPIRRAIAVFCALLLPVSLGFAQAPLPEVQQAPLMTPQQLDNVVSPLALYPDPLLGQVLAASTYPLEIVEAQQWLERHKDLQGAQLMDAARQENWDPSVQALVAFPDAMRLLSSDVRWTTDLGNAFLAQQSDVMSAVQRMRTRAVSNGRLVSTPQQTVTTTTEGNQSAVVIQPADPQVIYVPVYNPSYVWGPPAWGYYPDLYYGYGYGYGFGPSIYISGFFPGWYGWGGWGWGYGWFGGGLYINTGFFTNYGYHGYYYGRGYAGGGYYGGGRGTWAHNSVHRQGVPYSNQTVANRFNSNRFNGSRTTGGSNNQNFAGNRTTGGSNNQNFAGNRTGGSATGQRGGVQSGTNSTGTGTTNNGWRRFDGNNRTVANNSTGSTRQTVPNSNANVGSASPGNRTAQSFRGNNATPNYHGSVSNNRSFGSAPQAFAAPRQSAPQSFGSARQGGGAASAPRFSGGGAPSGGGRVSGGGGGGGGRAASSSRGGGGGGGGHRR